MIHQSHFWVHIQKTESRASKRYCTHMFKAVLLTIAKRCKQLKCPSVDECMSKMWYIHMMEYSPV